MLDPRIEHVRKAYDLSKDDFWKLPQGRDVWLVKHSALEVVAAKAGIVFEEPQIIEANGGNGVAAMYVRGHLDKRSVWSTGEANPKNCKTAYPWAIAEKRAIDRVVLKLIGLHGLVYSEEESDDFKPAMDRQEPPRKANGKPEQGWREDGTKTSFALKNEGSWEEVLAEFHEDAVDCDTLPKFEALKIVYRNKARERHWNREFMDGLAHEFNILKASIIRQMTAEELAEVPLDEALKQSLAQHPANSG